ncbi:integrase [Acidithiobacillus thiooxidans]|uniref:Integrase n=2 Tax=Acidithiobacillus thiooxidans TaxID=930 RepID=A0A1C2I9E1_ACITH|nr:integrase [Acidithiobacillus thiooxidans]OCX72593.1 integrase [Acidithiobacillus thiooxidans]OCX77521.1 integrase [Acidithiobacillus thiooxidans]OCX81221.1 integrase [Acidithiobacillus thiooxidans]OFC43280.1 integrase [Acidithiobacillus thiooxidans]
MASIGPRYDRDKNLIGWQARVIRKGFPTRSKTFRGKKEAEQWARSIESEMDKGVWRNYNRSESTSVTDLLIRYQSEILPEKKSRQSVESVIKIVCRSELGGYSLAQLLPESIAKYRDKRLSMVSEKTGKLPSPQTVRHEISLLSRVLNHAMKEWGIPLPLGNPCLQIKMPAQAQSRDRRLVDDEEKSLLDACTNAQTPWLKPIVIFAIETGMRSGEMLETWRYSNKEQTKVSIGLQWTDVDLNKRTAHLPKTKNGEARTVPLSSRAIQVLSDLPHNPNDPRVFGTTYEGIHQAFVRACKRAGIEDLRFHDLRHEAASRFFEKGLREMQVAAITGHKTLQMLKRYTHLRAEDLAKLLD